MAQVSSVKEYFDTIGNRFVASAAKGVNAVFQFELSGPSGGTFAVVVEETSVKVNEGGVAEPTVVLKMDADDYLKMANGKINGHWAAVTGKLKVSGNMMMAMKMQQLFPPSKG
jgi:putative sterol carrier protein